MYDLAGVAVLYRVTSDDYPAFQKMLVAIDDVNMSWRVIGFLVLWFSLFIKTNLCILYRKKKNEVYVVYIIGLTYSTIQRLQA